MSKFDIHIESLPQQQVSGSRCLTFGNYKKSLGVRGVQKMVNRFVMCMLTPIGTHLSDVDYGTPLASAFLGNIDEATVRSLALRSVNVAESKIREYDTEYEVPDTERLASVRVDNIYIQAGSGVILELTLKNAADVAVKSILSQTAE